jgi:hypothetical protein
VALIEPVRNVATFGYVRPCILEVEAADAFGDAERELARGVGVRVAG